MTENDKSPARLKGMGNNLCLSLSPDEPVELLREELHRLLGDIRHLTENAHILIDVGSPEGHEELVEEMGAFLVEHFGVASFSRPSQKFIDTVEQPVLDPVERSRRLDMDQSWLHHSSDVLMLAGRVRSGQKIAAHHHLVILGDVNPGAEVMAGGDILVMGTLLGTAIAGQPDDDSRIVLALDFRPTQVQIGSIVAAGPAAGRRNAGRKAVEFAHVEEKSIVVEYYMEANPFGRLPWPQAR